MPFFGIALATIFIAIIATSVNSKNLPNGLLEHKLVIALATLFSFISFVISVFSLYFIGRYADDHGASVIEISGGFTWLILNWVEIVILLVITIYSLMRLMRRKAQDSHDNHAE